MSNFQKIVISCGGTGGHFYPGLSIAREFDKQGGKALLMLSGIHAEAQMAIAASYGIDAIALEKMPRPSGVVGMWGFLRGFLKGMKRSKLAYREFAPNAYLSTGSFASLPTFIAARQAKLPIFLHDGNVRIGRANRKLSVHARKLFAAYPPCNQEAVGAKIEIVGMPLRPELGERLSKTDAATTLNTLYNWQLDPARPVALVMGGSQGARALNEAIAGARKLLSGADLQIIHLCGAKLHEESKALYGDMPPGVYLLPESQYMREIYSVADIAVARAGGSTIAELLHFGIFGVLVPYPYAAEDHQTDNARYMESIGAARLLMNELVNAEALKDEFTSLLSEPEKYSKLERITMHSNAAAEVLRQIEEEIL